MHTAVIVGHSGQDGTILWDQLIDQGFALVGISRHQLKVHNTQWSEAVDISDAASVRRLIDRLRPDHIYFLAAHHHSSQQQTEGEAAIWQASWNVHVQSFLYFLIAIKECHPRARIFYAGSSRVFGQGASSPQSENTAFRPACIYGMTKLTGMMLADYHRRNHGVFASCGILFNHESPLRGRDFVSQRVVEGLVAVKTGRMETLRIGNLEARVDWGYAPDFTRAMQLILQAQLPDDFVVASGKTHTVREMIEAAAECLDLQWESHVVEDAQILQRSPQELCGDFSRLRQVTGWQPHTSFRDMVQIMVKSALDRNRPEP
jgi:GDPmannose 4,6-dehydratase